MSATRRSLLVVEDDPSIRELMRICVEGEGDCRESGSIADARAEIARERPDVVILDLDLPDGRGEDLLPAIPRDVPVVIATASRRPQAAPGHVLSYVPKPFDPTMLRTIVRMALGRRTA